MGTTDRERPRCVARWRSKQDSNAGGRLIFAMAWEAFWTYWHMGDGARSSLNLVMREVNLVGKPSYVVGHNPDNHHTGRTAIGRPS